MSQEDWKQTVVTVVLKKLQTKNMKKLACSC